MDNSGFIYEDNIPLLHDYDDNYDGYKTPNTSRTDATPFMEHDTTEATSTLPLRQKVKRDKITALYRHLNGMGHIDLIVLDQFRLTTNPKTGKTDLLFLDGNKHWQSLTNKRTVAFFAAKILREKFGGLNIIKSVLSLDETPPGLERSFKAATKLRSELPTDIEMESIPLEKLSSLAEDIHLKTREASQNTDLDMR